MVTSSNRELNIWALHVEESSMAISTNLTMVYERIAPLLPSRATERFRLTSRLSLEHRHGHESITRLFASASKLSGTIESRRLEAC